MDNINRIKDKQVYNERFLSSFAWMMKKMQVTQAVLAKQIGINSPLISEYKSGRKRVSLETMEALARVSDGKLSVPYMQGLSDYMLLENAPDDEIIEIQRRLDNPDYEVMKRNGQRTASSPSVSVAPSDIPAWADSLINLVSQNTAIIHDLRAENAQLREAMIAVIEDNKKLRKYLAESLALMKHKQIIYKQEENILPMAAESQPSNDK